MYLKQNPRNLFVKQQVTCEAIIYRKFCDGHLLFPPILMAFRRPSPAMNELVNEKS